MGVSNPSPVERPEAKVLIPAVSIAPECQGRYAAGGTRGLYADDPHPRRDHVLNEDGTRARPDKHVQCLDIGVLQE